MIIFYPIIIVENCLLHTSALKIKVKFSIGYKAQRNSSKRMHCMECCTLYISVYIIYEYQYIYNTYKYIQDTYAYTYYLYILFMWRMS